MSSLTDAELGFILVCAAGLSTSIGAGVVYSVHLIKFTSKGVLASALGASAGVMIYVSFVEIFSKSLGAFEDAGHSPNASYLYATLCFFGGVIIMRLINAFVHWLDPSHMSHEDFDFDIAEELVHEEEKERHGAPPDVSDEVKVDEAKRSTVESERSTVELLALSADNKHESEDRSAYPAAAAAGGDKETNDAIKDTDPEQQGTVSTSEVVPSFPTSKLKGNNDNGIDNDEDDDEVDSQDSRYRELRPNDKDNAFDNEERRIEKEQMLAKKKKMYNRRLKRMGMFTALAIAIHNFPEGLATFIGTLNDPAVGAALAFAIAIHNIPEGLCVSVPIYFATKDRNRAFWWGFLSGISEIVGAGLGWIVLKDVFSDVIFGVLFGLVGGMMVSICVYELLPTARRYDPKDAYVSNAAVVGMAIMAMSLIVFLY